MDKASLSDCPAAEVVGLLQHSTDSSPELYRVLQGLGPATAARVAPLELNLYCGGEGGDVTLETYGVALGSDAVVYVLEVREVREGVRSVTRYAYETDGELESVFYGQVERLQRSYPDDDFDELLEAYAGDAAGLEDDAPLD